MKRKQVKSPHHSFQLKLERYVKQNNASDFRTSLKRNCKPVLQRVRERTAALEETQIEILERLALTAEYRDDDTGEHTRRVGQTAAGIAHALGWLEEEVELIRGAAPLHDLGKIAIPDSILLKPGKLTPEEFERMKSHTTLGAKMLSGGRFPLLRLAEQIALTHHERWDGSGYIGLREESIPAAGRIVAVADVFDALISERPYKKAWTRADAMKEIGYQSGRQFDPRVVKAFLRCLDSSESRLGLKSNVGAIQEDHLFSF